MLDSLHDDYDDTLQAAWERLLDDNKGGLNGDRILSSERSPQHRRQNTPLQVQGPRWLVDT